MGDMRSLKPAALLLALLVLAGCDEPVPIEATVERRAVIIDSTGYMGGIFCGPDGFIYQKQSAVTEGNENGWVLRNIETEAELPLPLYLKHSLRECTPDGRFLQKAFNEGGYWDPISVYDLSTLRSDPASLERPLVELGGDGFWDAKFLDNKTLLFEAVPVSGLSTESVGTVEVNVDDPARLAQSGLTILTVSNADLVARGFDTNTRVTASLGAYDSECDTHCSSLVAGGFVWDPATWTLRTPSIVWDPNQGIMEMTGWIDLQFDPQTGSVRPLVDSDKFDGARAMDMQVALIWPTDSVLGACGPLVSISLPRRSTLFCLDERISHGGTGSFWFDASDPNRFQIAVYYPVLKGEGDDFKIRGQRIFLYDVHIKP